MAEKRDILWRFLGDSKDLQKASKGATKSLGGTSKAMDVAKKAAGAMVAAYGARELLQFGQDAISAASDYEESLNAVEVSTGIASAEILKMGETSAEAFGLSKTEANEAAVAFAAFGENIDKDGNIADTFKDFLGRATDFASVMNVDVDDALMKFQSGLAGESEPLRKFGIDMSAASVSAFAVAAGIHATGKNMTEAEKQQARYGLLMQQTDKFAGDFANTTESVANQQKIANAEMKNASIELGKRLIPLQLKWVKGMRTAAAVLSGLVDEMSRADKESELLARTMFEAAKEAGKVTGEFEDLDRATQNAADSTSAWERTWDLMLGRTPNIDAALTAVGDQTARIALLQGMGVVAAGQYERALVGIQAQSVDTATNLKTMDELLDIFSGDLFKAARNAGKLTDKMREIEKLFGGGGGSGETAAPSTTRSAVDDRPSIVVNMGVVGDPDAAAQAVGELLTRYEEGNGTRYDGVSI